MKASPCQNILTQLENFPKPLGTIAALGKWTKDFNNIAGDKANVSKLDLDVFLRQGEKILLDESSIETCPLCEQPIDDPDALLKRLKSRYRKLEELREKLHQCESDWGSLAVNLRQMPTNLRNIKGGLKSKKIPCDFTVLGKCVAYLEQLIAHVEGQIKIRESCAVNFEVLNNVMDKAVSELRSAKGHIDKRIAGLAVTAEEKLKHDAYSKLLRGRDLLLQNLEYQKELRAYEKQIADMRYVSGQVVSLQNETLRNVLDTLASDVNKFFCFLNNRDAVKDVKFELVGDEGIEFSLSFYGREATPPRKYLSDSQQNSLGIAFFLAAVKNFNRTNKFFVLDDVLISFDKDYRVRLLELLERDFSDYQVVLLTHEDHWYETIKRMFPKWVHKEVGWSFTEGISFKGISQDWLNAASQRLNSGEKIGNELRIGTEGFLKQICISLDVRLPFRLGIDNDRRTNGELYSDLTATLNGHKCSIKDDQRYKQFGMLNFLMTASSHHNPGAESRGDMQELIRKIHDFRALFVCPDGEIVRRDSRVPGENKISCRCGKLKVEWKE